MKDKIIKNIGIMIGTSNLAFCGCKTCGKLDEIAKKAKEILKKYFGDEEEANKLIKNLYGDGGIYSTEKNKDKDETKYNLNKNITEDSVRHLFENQFSKIGSNCKKVLIIFKDNFNISTIEECNDNNEKIKAKYLEELGKKGSEPTFIAVEITPKNGKANEIKLVKCTNKTEEDKLRKLYQPGKPGEDNFDIKELFESVLSNNALKDSEFINIIKILNEKNLGYGLYDSDTYGIDLDGHIIIDVDKTDVNMLSSTNERDITASIKSDISSKIISGDCNQLSPKDVIIVQKDINGKKKLLIARAQDVSEGKIGEETIDKEFYKSSLEEFFNTVDNLGDDKNHFRDLIKVFIDEKYDCGQYELDQDTINKFRQLIYKDIDLDRKGLEWICLREDETSSTFYLYGFKRGIDFSGTTDMAVTSSGMDGDGWLKKDDIVVAVESNKNLLLIARGSDISAGTVNTQNIDESFYKNSK